MHITEGIVTGVPAVASTGIAVALMAVGAQKMRQFVRDHPDKKPLLGMAGAFVFFLSLMPLPAFTGTCSHPCGSPLAGILLGPWIGIALSGLSMLLQAAFFAHGGFSTWGVNLLALGVGGAFFGWLSFKTARRLHAPLWLAAGLGGFIGDAMTYLISGGLLAGVLSTGSQPQFTLTGYLLVIYAAYLPIQGPIAVGEMALTAMALYYIYLQRPEVLEMLRVVRPGERLRVPGIAVGLLVFGLLLISPAVAASPAPAPVVVAQGMAGMDEVVNERLAEEAGRPARAPFIDTESMGDLWNALLLLAGGVCGFILGRNWHLLFGRKTTTADTEPALVKES